MGRVSPPPPRPGESLQLYRRRLMHWWLAERGALGLQTLLLAAASGVIGTLAFFVLLQ